MKRKGINLISLIMYVLILTVLIGIIAVFNANIVDNSEKFVYTSRVYEQYCKFNMFFLETLSDASSVELLSSTSMQLKNSSNNVIGTYTYNANTDTIIYTYGVNTTIDVCKYVSKLKYVPNGQTLEVELEFQIKDINFGPLDIVYAIGSGNQ
ncbi:MAG: hypothetical protein PHH22_03675 [Clostridia bacterium]|nr:hypothetical protein [Clostridia bacterium]